MRNCCLSSIYILCIAIWQLVIFLSCNGSVARFTKGDTRYGFFHLCFCSRNITFFVHRSVLGNIFCQHSNIFCCIILFISLHFHLNVIFGTRIKRFLWKHCHIIGQGVLNSHPFTGKATFCNCTFLIVWIGIRIVTWASHQYTA